MMFTKKKTQVISALCAVMMLISLMTCFAFPVSAESIVYPDAGEVVSETGLYDASVLPDIKDYPQDGSAYKVTDVAGMQRIAELVNREKETFEGITIYQAADIDFTGTPFDGIGVYGNGDDVAFKGVFDGNGFVIENLYLYGVYYVGLFNAASGATLRNIGIASGLVVGGIYAAALCARADSVQIVNCWTAATVIGGSRSGACASSFAGESLGTTAIYNSYNLGMILNGAFFAAGMAGKVGSADVALKNSFNAGSLFYSHHSAYPEGYEYNALYRNGVTGKAGTLTDGTMNSYYISTLTVPAHKAGAGKETVGAMTPTQFADGTVAATLNAVSGDDSMNTLGAVDGYTVSYTNTEDLDFPVITYSEGDTVKVRRVPHTTVNVNGDHTAWMEKSAVWRDFMPRYNGGYEGVGVVTVDTANDLYMFALISSTWNNPDSDSGVTGLNITADIDMNDVTLPGVPRTATGEVYSTPLGGTSAQISQAYGMKNMIVDAQGHSIYNWNVYSSSVGDVGNSGFIGYIGNGTVQNLNLVDATVIRSNDLNDYSANNADNKRSHSAGLLVGTASSNVKILDCSVTGTVIYLNHTNEEADRSTVGGLLGDAKTAPTISNSWSSCTVVMADGETFKAGAVGFALLEVAPENLTNTYFAADEMPATMNDYTANMQAHCMEYAINEAEFAYKLTRLGFGTYTVNEEGIIVSGTEDQVPAQVRFIMAINGQEAAELEYVYIVPGKEVAPRTYEGFTLDPDSLPSGSDSDGVFVMTTKNVELQYINDYVNLLPVRNVIEKLERFDPNLFVDSNPVDVALGVAEEMIRDYAALEEAESVENLATINKEVLNLVILSDNLDMELVDVYPHYVPFSERELYAQFGDPENYLIRNGDDWEAAVESGETFEGKTLHLADDIDLDNYSFLPMVELAGDLDGHGHRFENLNMKIITHVGSVGLISQLTGTVKNVGIGSGSVFVQYNSEVDNYGVGALVGTAYSTARIIACWNAAEVYVEPTREVVDVVYENPVAGLVGYAYSGAILDTCYNIGTVTGGDLVADLVNGEATVYNSFGAGTLNCNYGFTPYVVGGYEFGGAEAKLINTYGVGNKAFCKDTYSNMLDWDAYESGQVGWEINQNYVYTMLQERVYFTADINGYPVFSEGPLSQQVKTQLRRVVIEKSNGETEYVYAPGGETVALNVLLALELELAAESTDIATLDGSILTLDTVTNANATESVIVHAYISPLNIDALVEEVLYFLYKDFDHFANPTALRELFNRILYTEYTTQEAIDADTVALRALKVYTYDVTKLPSASLNFLYDDAPGYTVNDYADLEYVSMFPEEFGADKVLYLTADLEMFGKKYEGITGLAASVDGLGHVINNYTDGHAFFMDFAGSYIKDLTFKDATVTAAGILVDRTVANTVIDGISMVDCVLTGEAHTPAGLLIGTANGETLTVKNSEAVNSTATYAEENTSGLLVGTASASAVFSNIGLFGNVTNAAALIAGNEVYASVTNVFTADNSGATAFFTADAAVNNEKTYAGDGYVSVDAMNASMTNPETLWNMNGETSYPALALYVEQEKNTITFQKDGVTVDTAYTDVNGRLYAPSTVIVEGKWDVKGPITEAVFTADTVVVAMLEGNIVVKPVGVVKPGEEVLVEVSIESNPGLKGVEVTVTPDYTNFELIDITSGTLFDPTNFTVSEDALTSGAAITVIASGHETVAEDGVIFTLTLKAKDTLADGTYTDAVVVAPADHVDTNHNRSILYGDSCAIVVREQGFLWGDVNADGFVLTDDVVLIMQTVVGFDVSETMISPAAGDLDGREGLSVVDAQMILRALADPTIVLQPVNL